MGADEADSYILKKVVKDRMITLSDKMILSTWNIVNGKHICTYDKSTWLTLSNYN
jgi:hypothetical protein